MKVTVWFPKCLNMTECRSATPPPLLPLRALPLPVAFALNPAFESSDINEALCRTPYVVRINVVICDLIGVLVTPMLYRYCISSFPCRTRRFDDISMSGYPKLLVCSISPSQLLSTYFSFAILALALLSKEFHQQLPQNMNFNHFRFIAFIWKKCRHRVKFVCTKQTPKGSAESPTQNTIM